MAGVRDDAPATLFDKIISGEIPAAIVKQDDKILAFKDINPQARANPSLTSMHATQAPVHVLVISKTLKIGRLQELGRAAAGSCPGIDRLRRAVERCCCGRARLFDAGGERRRRVPV